MGLIFTDDDLKRLKEAMMIRPLIFPSDKLKALLARLEAAEEALKETQFLEGWNEGYGGSPSRPKLEAWRKAAGK